jgi:hypothetical protein
VATKAYQIAFNDEPVEEEFYGDVVTVSVEENTSMAGALHLRLATRVEDDGSWSLLEDPRLSLFTKVSASIGFTGGEGLTGALGGLTGSSGNDGLEPVFTGYITAINVNLSGKPGQSQIDVHAMDNSVLMSLEEKIVRWPNLSDSDIVRQIVSGYGVEIEADSTATVHQENDTTIVQRGTDIQFVRELARRNSLEFYFETDKDSGSVKAYLRAPQLDGTPQPDLAIQFGPESNLKSFLTRLGGQRPLNVKVAQIDVKANGANTAQASSTRARNIGQPGRGR